MAFKLSRSFLLLVSVLVLTAAAQFAQASRASDGVAKCEEQELAFYAFLRSADAEALPFSEWLQRLFKVSREIPSNSDHLAANVPVQFIDENPSINDYRLYQSPEDQTNRYPVRLGYDIETQLPLAQIDSVRSKINAIPGYFYQGSYTRSTWVGINLKATEYASVRTEDGTLFSVPIGSLASSTAASELIRISNLARHKITDPEIQQVIDHSTSVIHPNRISVNDGIRATDVSRFSTLPVTNGLPTHVEVRLLHYFGKYSGDAKYLLTKTQNHGNLSVETTDTIVTLATTAVFPEKLVHASRQPSESRLLTVDLGPKPFERMTEAERAAAVAAGQQRQKEQVDEVAAFVFPLYESRRAWDRLSIAKFYKKLRASAENTRLIKIRKIGVDGTHGGLLATLGLNRSTYGKVRFFDRNSQKWLELTNVSSIPASFDNSSGKGPYAGGWNGSIYLDVSWFSTWFTHPKALGMESALADHATLPRPAVLASFLRLPANQEPPLKAALKEHGIDADPDLSRGVFSYAGQITEPVVFALAKKEELRGVAYSEILQDVFRTIFSVSSSSDFSELRGQMLYTFNDPNGIALYKKMGFEPMTGPGAPTVEIPGFVVLGCRPQSLAQFLAHAGTVDEETARKILEDMERVSAARASDGSISR